jgi:hypothetical protein
MLPREKVCYEEIVASAYGKAVRQSWRKVAHQGRAHRDFAHFDRATL